MDCRPKVCGKVRFDCVCSYYLAIVDAVGQICSLPSKLQHNELYHAMQEVQATRDDFGTGGSTAKRMLARIARGKALQKDCARVASMADLSL